MTAGHDRALTLANRIAAALDWPFDDDPTHIRPVWRQSRERRYPWGTIVAWTANDSCRGLITPCPGVTIDFFTAEHPLAAAYVGIHLDHTPTTVFLRGGNLFSGNRLASMDAEHRVVCQTIDAATDGLMTHALRQAGETEWLAWLWPEDDPCSPN